VHALSNSENQASLSFQPAELSLIEYEICWIFHTPPYLEPEMEMKLVEFFMRFGLPDY
jgi:hypothetical protein